MKLRINDLDLVKNVNILFEHEIIIWGAGVFGEKTARILDEIKAKVCCFYDKDFGKAGSVIAGYPVFLLEQIMTISHDKDVIIIISSMNFADEMLSDIGNSDLPVSRVYSYAGMWRSIELNINSEYFSDEYRTRFWERWKIHTAFRVADYWKGEYKRLLMNLPLKDEEMVFILTPAKVGTTSIYQSLSNYGFKCIRGHDFDNWEMFRDYAVNGMQKVKIVSAVREPIAKEISWYMQYLRDEYIYRDWYLDLQPDILKGLLDYLDKGSRIKDTRVFSWFSQIEDFTGIDVYKYDFDRENGYGIIRQGKWEILILQLEKLDNCTDIIGVFMGINDFILEKANEGRHRDYRYIYKQIKEELVIPEDVVARYYESNPKFDHFYTLEDKIKLKSKYV